MVAVYVVSPLVVLVIAIYLVEPFLYAFLLSKLIELFVKLAAALLEGKGAGELTTANSLSISSHDGYIIPDQKGGYQDARISNEGCSR
jgi:hypothetical protein